ncbi:leucyl aminopeptidase [Candidatus Woesearchaeota archaeon]|nr:leucyl aminopeptidase [Candidatus Woesearchaeota archaeon]
MKLMVKECLIKNLNADVLVIPVFKDMENKEKMFVEVNNILNKLLSQTIYENPDIGEEGKFHMFYTNSRLKLKRVLLAGLGESDELDLEKIRNLGGKLAAHIKNNSMKDVAFLSFGYDLKNVTIEAASKALVVGFKLGDYKYEEFKTENMGTKEADKGKKKYKGINSLLFVPQVKSDLKLIENVIKDAEIVSNNVCIVRDLVNKPANMLSPSLYVKEIKKIFTKSKVKVKILEEAAIKKEKMGCIINVAKGSVEKPKLVVLTYSPPKAKKTIVFVGKGVTFDAGGTNLKPSQYISNMKQDMGGSAAVVGAVKSAAEMKFPIKVIGIMPLVENLISGTAMKTGDVITAANGKTIEVENTDAEGRLILADALHYATKFKPYCIVDIATLTGAASVALGSRCTSLMGNDQDLIKNLIEAGEKMHEKAWQLPLFKEYDEDIKSDIADLKNMGNPGGEAGTIIGGMFLQNFIGENKWVHLDIGATAFTAKPNAYKSKGATGVPVRMLVKWMRGLF